jgi:predicted nucleic-acid-binding Zn-ribbon protein
MRILSGQNKIQFIKVRGQEIILIRNKQNEYSEYYLFWRA